jgi:hypothetical protein
MDGSSLPRYQLPSDDRSDTADRRIDWTLVAGRLLIRGLVIGFVVLMLFTVALYLTGGQILWLLRGGWD